MVEFKKRYGLEGSTNGLDVTHDWSPTMTEAWGLPILMDPRLNGVPNRMGLVSPYLEDYKAELHNIHYEWNTLIVGIRFKPHVGVWRRNPSFLSVSDDRASFIA